jgi:hypothetical protein
MTGLEWYHFRKLIERNKKPWRYLRYYRSKDGFQDTISICDFSLPRRKGVINTGDSEADWYRDSYVCNAGYFAGTIPLYNNPTLWDEDNKKWVKKPARGAMSVMKVLASDGVVERTPEVLEFIRTGYWRPE